MKRFFTRLTKLLCGLLIPGFLFAQGSTDYNILLHAGKFIPAANASTISKSSAVLRNSGFDDKHYVTIQFNSIPTNEMKEQLRTAGVQLIEYIPNYAYTAAVRKDFDLAQFKTFPVRSVFQFTSVQKAVPQLFTGEIPSHAVKSPGTVDITVITYEKLSASKVLASFNALNAYIVEDMPVFRRFTLRVTANNASKVVALPFVQWVEFIDPPNFVENLPEIGRAHV